LDRQNNKLILFQIRTDCFYVLKDSDLQDRVDPISANWINWHKNMLIEE